MKDFVKKFGAIIISLLVLTALVSYPGFKQEKPDEAGINRLVDEINKESVQRIEVAGDNLLITLKDQNAKKLEIKKEFNQSFSELAQNYGIAPEKLQKIEVVVKKESGFSYWLAIVGPWIIPILLLLGLVFFMSRVQGANNRAMGFGQSRAKEAKPDEKNKKTFADVAGSKESKQELEEIVEFLKHPKKFAEMGAKIPKGVLLMGAPGTGKTLLAKAVAGEADVPFFHISGSEFVEMFVGVGASRVRDLFQRAKKAAPAIVFIDEIDAVGRKRGAGLGGSHDEREQTLNQILVEMDGFEPNSGVIILAATNRPDVLDQALLRPGRFDRRVVIDMPDIDAREEILTVHAKNKPLAKDVKLREVAERTPGMAGADLESVLNEAAILAVRQDKKEIDAHLILEAIEKVILGPEKKSRVMTEKDREMTAYHEAGHAIVGHFLEYCDPVRKVSIIGRGMAGGYTLSVPERDIPYRTIAKFKDDMAMMLGGYVIERKKYGDEFLTTGPSSDLQKATETATKMILRYGMSDKLGPRVYGENEGMIFLAEEIHNKKNYSEKIAETIDEEINALLEEAKKRATEVIEKHEDALERLVKVLMEKESIERDEFVKVVGEEAPKKEEPVQGLGGSELKQ